MHDPQELSFWGKIKVLTALGRIPLASEVPNWTLLGCILASQIFPSSYSSGGEPTVFRAFDWRTALQCSFITWASNISINYGNEWWDYDLDRPGQVQAIQNDVKRKRDAEDAVKRAQNGHGSEKEKRIAFKTKDEVMIKAMGNTTRCIHDGTFPPYVTLLCSAAWQFAVVAVILISRSGPSSPFRGLALQLAIFGTLLSQFYVAPPFKLHYRGLGEVSSSFLMVPTDITFGLVSHYTAVTGGPISFGDLFRLFDSQMWNLLLATYLFSQARIFVMHIPDIKGDKAGNKITLCVRIGHTAATHLYAVLNLLSFTAFAAFIYQLSTDTAGTGLLNRVAGGMPLRTPQAIAAHRNAWLGGLCIVAAYWLPVATIVYNSLLAADPSRAENTADLQNSAITAESERSGSFIPTIHVTTCAIIASLQLLVTPCILCITVLLAGRAGLKV